MSNTICYERDHSGEYVVVRNERGAIEIDLYAIAWNKPNYPMPATYESQEVASSYLLLSLCPFEDGPCMICIEKYLDTLEDIIGDYED